MQSKRALNTHALEVAIEGLDMDRLGIDPVHQHVRIRNAGQCGDNLEVKNDFGDVSAFLLLLYYLRCTNMQLLCRLSLCNNRSFVAILAVLIYGIVLT